MPLISSCTPKSQPIKVSTHLWPGYQPMYLAQKMGWLDSKKVELTEAATFVESISLLEQGKVHAAGVTLDEVLRMREKEIPISVIFVCDVSAGADMVLALPTIKSLTELKGKRLAVEDGALGMLMLHQVLLASGLKREQIKVISVPVDKQPEAWKNGEIDAAITFEPGASQLMKMGAKVLFDSRQIPELIFDVIAVRTDMMDGAHDEAVRHLVASHLRGLNHINTNPGDASYRMAEHFKLPADEVMATFKGLVLPDLSNNTRLLSTASPAMLQSAAVVAHAMRAAGILHKPENLTGMIRAEYLPRASS